MTLPREWPTTDTFSGRHEGLFSRNLRTVLERPSATEARISDRHRGVRYSNASSTTSLTKERTRGTDARLARSTFLFWADTRPCHSTGRNSTWGGHP